MYNLQEAYLGVYYDLDEARQEEGLTDKQKRRIRRKRLPHDEGRGKRVEKIRQDWHTGQRGRRGESPLAANSRYENEPGRRIRGQGYVRYDDEEQNEQLDLYDLIFDYLLDEGYADTEEAATVIMANMSEDWIDDIYEEVLDERRNVTDRPLGILHRFARGVRTKKGEKTERLGTDREGNPTQKYYVMQRQKREAQRERDADEARRRDNDAMGRGTWDKD